MQRWTCGEKVGDLGPRGIQGRGVGETAEVGWGPTHEEQESAFPVMGFRLPLRGGRESLDVLLGLTL